MQMRDVASSNLAKVGWAVDTLVVEFKAGGLYAYSGVPHAEFDALAKAGSKGKHFIAHIRPNYPCRKLADLAEVASLVPPGTAWDAAAGEGEQTIRVFSWSDIPEGGCFF